MILAPVIFCVATFGTPERMAAHEVVGSVVTPYAWVGDGALVLTDSASAPPVSVVDEQITYDGVTQPCLVGPVHGLSGGTLWIDDVHWIGANPIKVGWTIGQATGLCVILEIIWGIFGVPLRHIYHALMLPKD